MTQGIFFGIGFIIFVHLAVGHSPTNIIKDFPTEIIISFGLFAGIACLRLTQQMIKAPLHLWNRNRQAAKLAKKVNRLEKLTLSEQNQLDRFIKEGILKPIPYTYRNQWRMYVQLSNRSINDALYY